MIPINIYNLTRIKKISLLTKIERQMSKRRGLLKCSSNNKCLKKNKYHKRLCSKRMYLRKLFKQMLVRLLMLKKFLKKCKKLL